MVEKNKVKVLRLDELDNAILNALPAGQAMTASEIYVALMEDIDMYLPPVSASTVATRLRLMTGWNRYVIDDKTTPLERVVLNRKSYYMHREED